tara:strand:- start:24 stop:1445 length:1422 start_codon:yes stop_codon:yes gene_type:complete
MLNKLRNFSKGKLAGVLVGIIIIPFVFWGMGSVFSGGNTNSIAKINNQNVSTQDFADFVNNSKISSDVIKENIDNNILEQLLTQLVSISLIDLEINKLNFSISDIALAKRIRTQESFLDKSKNFSRTKYEKFLLENNISSVQFEMNIRDNELKKKLFTYISGGIKSPFFLINKTYKEELKKVEIDFIDLNSIYKNKNDISLSDIEKHINENKTKFLVEKIDVSIARLTPQTLSGENEFTENFFSKIDEIDDLLSNNNSISEISKKYNLKVETFEEYSPVNNNEPILNEIYNERNSKTTDLVDKNDFFLLYEISNLKKVLPKLEDDSFYAMVKNDLFEINKYEVHKDLLTKIQKKKFTQQDFSNLSGGSVNNLKINSIKDTTKFTSDSVKLIYSLGLNSFSLISDDQNNVYLIKVKNIYENNLNKNDKDSKIFGNQTDVNLRDNLYNSYDFLLNEKYKININEKTLERMKNYFR